MSASLIALGTLALRCNTYLGTDVTSSGAGIETCVVPINHCIQREYWFFGVRTYSMECDDLLQCLSVPPGECCTNTRLEHALPDGRPLLYYKLQRDGAQPLEFWAGV